MRGKGKQIYTGYYITKTGKVWSAKTKRYLTQRVLNSGYKYVALNINGKQYLQLVHRLVAQAFLENPKGYECINHKDENKLNNRVDNLEWCDRSYNITYSWGKSVLDETTGKTYPSIRAAAKDIGCPEQQLWQVLHNVKGRRAKGHTVKFIKEKVKIYA